jgi:hypothetical protein
MSFTQFTDATSPIFLTVLNLNEPVQIKNPLKTMEK